jgi:prepilin-type N-terminal cleavage/methylation domain-containing protein
MHDRKSSGFTLIELLVVISIIALLASVVLASLSGATAKAKLAAGNEMDAHTFGAFGADAAAIYDFDKGSGTTIYDHSSNFNNLTCSSGPTWTSSTYSGKGYAMAFNSAGNCYKNGPIHLSNKVVTVTAWVYYTGFHNWETIVGHGWVGNGWDFYVGVDGKLRFGVGQAGVQHGAASAAALSLNTWHFVVGAYDGTKVHVYVDGAATGVTSALSGATLDTTSSISIGGSTTGILDQIRIYTDPLGIASIQKLYAEGLPAHMLASAAY